MWAPRPARQRKEGLSLQPADSPFLTAKDADSGHCPIHRTLEGKTGRSPSTVHTQLCSQGSLAWLRGGWAM